VIATAILIRPSDMRAPAAEPEAVAEPAS
jgi:hypothetical protein